MDLTRMEKLIEIAERKGLDDLEIRVEVYLVVGGEKARVFSVQTEPELFPATMKGFTDNLTKLAELRGELQKALDEKS